MVVVLDILLALKPKEVLQQVRRRKGKHVHNCQRVLLALLFESQVLRDVMNFGIELTEVGGVPLEQLDFALFEVLLIGAVFGVFFKEGLGVELAGEDVNDFGFLVFNVGEQCVKQLLVGLLDVLDHQVGNQHLLDFIVEQQNLAVFCQCRKRWQIQNLLRIEYS